jgi:hypothetical protein
VYASSRGRNFDRESTYGAPAAYQTTNKLKINRVEEIREVIFREERRFLAKLFSD